MALTGIDWPALLAQHDMIWEAPGRRWLDGLPLGNGHIGAMMWGDGAPLILTLDKYDCWELRERIPDPATYNYANLRQLVEAGDGEAVRSQFWMGIGDPNAPKPTRLPLPRLELRFPNAAQEFNARLRLSDATVDGALRFPAGEVKLNAFLHATRRLIVIRLTGEPRPDDVAITVDHLSNPPETGTPEDDEPSARDTLASWGYEEPECGQRDGAEFLRLRFPAGGEYVVASRRAERPDGMDIFLSIVSHNDAETPLDDAIAAVNDAADQGFEALHDAHATWWRDYWPASYLSIPDSKLENLYWVELYKLGCSTRPDGLPISLQGLWTCDGTMPPWFGEYALDMNIQASYWPVYTANRLDLGQCLYDTFFACLPRFEQNCRDFFGFDGAWSGCAVAPDGARMFGYPTTEFSPGNGAWLAHMYWLHWLYSQDEQFLRDRAVPFMAAFMRTYMNLLEEGPDGRLHIPLSNSPEYHEGSLEAWAGDPACDLALIRWLGESLLSADHGLGLGHIDASRWQETLDRLADYPRDKHGGFSVCADMPLAYPHRHHSHLMSVYPLGLISSEDEQWRDVLDQTIDTWREWGTGAWIGWSFPWASAIAARAGLPNMAWHMLDLYARCFVEPNSLHVNGDHRSFGASQYTYEPMTVEAGFCAAAAIMEMLLQSYRGVIRVFPAIPDHWHDACFADLRAEGAFLVSSRMCRRRVQYVAVTSEAGIPCRVRSPWDGPVHVTGPDGASKMDGPVIEFQTVAGARYVLHADGVTPSDADLAPQVPSAAASEGNWFGVKTLARF